MRSCLLGALIAACAVPAAAQKVEVASGDWSRLPVMETSNYVQIPADAVDQIHRLVTSGQCELKGASKRRIDMTVPFLVRFAPDGSLDHVVLRDLGCPKAEGILARVVLNWAKTGTIKSGGTNKEGWYRSEISFSSTS